MLVSKSCWCCSCCIGTQYRFNSEKFSIYIKGYSMIGYLVLVLRFEESKMKCKQHKIASIFFNTHINFSHNAFTIELKRPRFHSKNILIKHKFINGKIHFHLFFFRFSYFTFQNPFPFPFSAKEEEKIYFGVVKRKINCDFNGKWKWKCLIIINEEKKWIVRSNSNTMNFLEIYKIFRKLNQQDERIKDIFW